MRAWVWVVVFLLAGCTAQPHADESPVQPAGEPPTGAAAMNMTEGDHANRTLHGAPRPVFSAQEHDLHVGPYAHIPAANQSTGNMKDASWTVDIPAGARTITLVANVTNAGPSLIVGSLDLMIHNGTAEEPGPMLAGTNGSAEYKVGPVPIPEGARTLCAMFHAEGDPAAAQGPMDAHLMATFA
ncbi:MAG: hypothetical protein LC624_07475 [Halobacteriales archaeon]|nr:hypothetical protein [Halobacteriales archaeon]